jgi:hypothetical protein
MPIVLFKKKVMLNDVRKVIINETFLLAIIKCLHMFTEKMPKIPKMPIGLFKKRLL